MTQWVTGEKPKETAKTGMTAKTAKPKPSRAAPAKGKCPPGYAMLKSCKCAKIGKNTA